MLISTWCVGTWGVDKLSTRVLINIQHGVLINFGKLETSEAGFGCLMNEKSKQSRI